MRKTRPFEANQEGAEIKPGEFFILGAQKAYVAEVGDEFLTEQGRKNARMRAIFDNGTEIRGLLRSFQRALYKDEAGRWVSSPSAGPSSTRATRLRATRRGRSTSCGVSRAIRNSDRISKCCTRSA